MKVQKDLALCKVLFAILPNANNFNSNEHTQLITTCSWLCVNKCKAIKMMEVDILVSL